MKDMAIEMPGLEKVRAKFLHLLPERQNQIAEHALAAWDATDPADVVDNLTAACAILHQIAGSAGTLGLVTLGEAAQKSELSIQTHLERTDSIHAQCPAEIVKEIDTFVSIGQAVLEQQT